MSSGDPMASPRRCRATSKRTGQQCGQHVPLGSTVCKWHGGATPNAKRAAALRLIELIDPSIATLAREMATASRSADRQRAANSILDRAGVPRTAMTVDGDAAKALLFERLISLRDSQQRSAAVAATETITTGLLRSKVIPPEV